MWFRARIGGGEAAFLLVEGAGEEGGGRSSRTWLSAWIPASPPLLSPSTWPLSSPDRPAVGRERGGNAIGGGGGVRGWNKTMERISGSIVLFLRRVAHNTVVCPLFSATRHQRWIHLQIICNGLQIIFKKMALRHHKPKVHSGLKANVKPRKILPLKSSKLRTVISELSPGQH